MYLEQISWLAWLAPVVMMWSQLKNTLSQAVRLVVRQDTFDHTVIFAVEEWLQKHGRKLPGAKTWGQTYVPIAGCRERGPVIMDAGAITQVWLVGRLCIPVVWNVKEGTLTYVLGSVNVYAILDAVAVMLTEVERDTASFDELKIWQDSRFGTGFSLYYWPDAPPITSGMVGQTKSAEEPGPPADSSARGVGGYVSAESILQQRTFGGVKPWFNVHPLWRDMRDDVRHIRETYRVKHHITDVPPSWAPLDKLMDDFRRWAQAGSWCVAKGISWRRGALLRGQPGTGKSEIVSRLARAFNCRLIVVDLCNMNNSSLHELAAKLRTTGRQILLIEDIDATFEGRTNMSDAGIGMPKLSFDALINFLGGVDDLHGTYVIVTTNRPEVLDSALVRAGRLDLHIDVPPMTRDEALDVGMFMLDGDREAVLPLLDSLEFPVPASAVAEKFKLEAMRRRGLAASL